jgi:alpha-glucosidase
MLSLYRALLRLRRAEPALSIGSYHLISAEDNVLIFERRHLGRSLVVALNFDAQDKRLPRDIARARRLLTSAAGRAGADLGPGRLRLNEGIIVERTTPASTRGAINGARFPWRHDR